MACNKAPVVALAFLILVSFSCPNNIVLGARIGNNMVHETMKNNANAKVDKDCLGHEGTVLIPGIGRYAAGSHEKPNIRGLDHSIPAAVNGKYMPGNDDTFVPNPGFEVPNPFRPRRGGVNIP